MCLLWELIPLSVVNRHLVNPWHTGKLTIIFYPNTYLSMSSQFLDRYPVISIKTIMHLFNSGLSSIYCCLWVWSTPL